MSDYKNDYKTDRKWSDEWIPAIKTIVGPLMLCESTQVEDCKEATDLIILLGRDMRIACHIRRPGFVNKYPHDFCVRSYRPTGAETELSKFMNGFGDWLFCGHVNKDETAILPWMMIDLHVWRARVKQATTVGLCGWLNGKKLWEEKINKDETRFRAYDSRAFPPDPPILIARSELPASVPTHTVKAPPLPVRVEPPTCLEPRTRRPWRHQQLQLLP